MIEETTVYEPPAMTAVGEFDEVTLGGGGRGYEYNKQCLIFC
ncbi:lasso RiPP family leader peptide-containing protein [Amycolatopsis magusensis]|uniref:Lasso RiPP family leader peptide-containing protein n=1 Tax=Amycolatopsis magusensis TaxID=882444 RepID=A0ABS4PTY6_9PSEU|nr:lasso RiPP family leader peptide-containing protein [Amycolatopsis magusensis]MBP2182773.1 hypothetical protein [Amycolatopsis magusensis]MDI5980182.1 lasso RiPP family leader peptide-containing protein [Amycolatopsis magusensis]